MQSREGKSNLELNWSCAVAVTDDADRALAANEFISECLI